MRLFVIFQFFLLSCSERENTKVRIVSELIDLGTYSKDETRSASFVMINTGDRPLVIRDVTTDCQCTLAKWSKDEVVPRDSVTITVNYNNDNLGKFQKLVYVNANVKSPITLILRGKVN